jgi:hypothetical protein
MAVKETKNQTECRKKENPMKKERLFVLALTFACAASWTLCAWAADTPTEPGKSAPAAKAPDTPQTPPAAPSGNSAPAASGKVRSEVKCEVTGKLEEKKISKKDGTEGVVLEITVVTAKSEDGKALDGLTGKTLRVAAGKANMKLASFAGKEVTISGTAISGRRLKAASIK